MNVLNALRKKHDLAQAQILMCEGVLEHTNDEDVYRDYSSQIVRLQISLKDIDQQIQIMLKSRMNRARVKWGSND